MSGGGVCGMIWNKGSRGAHNVAGRTNVFACSRACRKRSGRRFLVDLAHHHLAIGNIGDRLASAMAQWLPEGLVAVMCGTTGCPAPVERVHVDFPAYPAVCGAGGTEPAGGLYPDAQHRQPRRGARQPLPAGAGARCAAGWPSTGLASPTTFRPWCRSTCARRSAWASWATSSAWCCWIWR